MEPVYRHIEFCSNPKTLWGKLREGRWDWLGVHPGGKFVLGSPRRSGVISDYAAATLVREEASEGEHGVEAATEPRRDLKPSSAWFTTEEEAVAEYNRRIAEYRAAEGPLVVRIRRIEQRATADEEFIVTRPPTYR